MSFKSFITALLSIANLAADPGKEPPLNYTLTIGDKAFPINKDKPFEVDGIEGKHQAKLTSENYRIFPYQNVNFKYPSYFSFAARITKPNYKSWELSGSRSTIRLAIFRRNPNEKQYSTQQLAELVTKRFGDNDTKFTSKNIVLGKKTYKCVRASVIVANQKVLMDVISLPASEGWTKCLQIQYLQDEKASKEYALVTQMLERSFRETVKP